MVAFGSTPMTNPDDAPQVPGDRDGQRPYVVGIGASAGGIEALKEFFHHVAPDSGAAYVVIPISRPITTASSRRCCSTRLRSRSFRWPDMP